MKPIKITNKTDISLVIRRLIRQSVGANKSCPISFKLGNSPPKIVGESYHYENKSGDLIRHPSAYKRAWGKPIYISSSRQIEVGFDWIWNNLTLDKITNHKLVVFK